MSDSYPRTVPCQDSTLPGQYLPGHEHAKIFAQNKTRQILSLNFLIEKEEQGSNYAEVVFCNLI